MKSIGTIASVFLTAAIFFVAGAADQKHVFSTRQRERVHLRDVLGRISPPHVVLVGEHHGRIAHHRGQLEVIRQLHDAGMKVIVGLEMFRSDSQWALDQWIAGDIEESRFKKIYYDNWTFDWSAYAIIFRYARENGIPLIGLNVPREITRQVSRGGFESLSPEQKGALRDVTCRVDDAYMDYIRKAYGAHAHGNLNFEFFCEAQMVWDNVMAINALDPLKRHKDTVLIILTGVGHAQKMAIPEQIHKRSEFPVTVFLPEVPGILDANTIGLSDADYLLPE